MPRLNITIDTMGPTLNPLLERLVMDRFSAQYRRTFITFYFQKVLQVRGFGPI